MIQGFTINVVTIPSEIWFRFFHVSCVGIPVSCIGVFTDYNFN